MHKDHQYLLMLAAGIKQDVSGKWVSTDHTEEDSLLGAPGGKMRVYAAALLAQERADIRIITGGGMGYDVPTGTSRERPPLAEILRAELIDRGVDANRLILESTSCNTFQELIELERFISQYQIEKCTILTSRWHLPRLSAMIKIKFERMSKNVSFELVSAEDVLIAHDANKWKTLIESAYQTDWMRTRIKMEDQGTKQIINGTYHFKDWRTMNLTLRKAVEEDGEQLFVWRNDPRVYHHYHNAQPVSREDHFQWLSLSLDNKMRDIYIVELVGNRVAMIRFDYDCEEKANLSWAVDPEWQGRGIGVAMLKKAREFYSGTLFAEIKKENTASIKMAEAVGFVLNKEEFGVLYFSSFKK